MRTLTRYTVEEVFEVVDCIERDDIGALPDELGDLLFQIVFYARIAEEEGRFGFGDVVARVVDKLTRRHPHVFAGAPLLSAAEEHVRWEQIKQAERGARRNEPLSALADVPQALPALMRALKLQARAARVGFDWSSVPPVLAKIEEEIAELQAAVAAGEANGVEAELGDLLFSCVNLARHLGVDPETALRRTNSRFEKRFRYMEMAAATAGQSLEELSAAAQDCLWEDAKRALDDPPASGGPACDLKPPSSCP